MRVEGAIDIHVHAGPDVRPRKTSAAELAASARGAGMAGFVLKRHHTSTVAEAAALSAAFPDLHVAGGIALNGPVGGLNPSAVEAALTMGAAVVWLPTFDAAHEQAFRGRPGRGIAVCDERGSVRPEAADVVALVARHRATLALGHISPPEMSAVVALARSLGVARILVNHPEIRFLDLPIGFQRSLAGPDVIFERCYVRGHSAIDWDGLAACIRAVGVDSTALATDLGQPDNPHPVDGLAAMQDRLAERGFSDDELSIMSRRNPGRVLGKA